MGASEPTAGVSAADVRAFGDSAAIRFADGLAEARALAAAARAARWPMPVEVVTGFRSVLVSFEPGGDLSAVMALLGRLTPDERAEPTGRRVRIPVSFDGPDLGEVAEQSGIPADEVISLLTSAELEVGLLGFSPGFAYLVGVPDPLSRIRRRATPRPKVPAGSVALAGRFAAVYPSATPGGWQLVGRTAMTLFDPAQPPYAVLSPGDRVRFESVPGLPAASGPQGLGSDAAQYRRSPVPASDAVASGISTPATVAAGVSAPGTAAIVVEDPGTFAMVQDRGRIGTAGLGVPRAGPADPLGHQLANLLVGNPPGAAAIEMTARGSTLRSRSPLAIAVVGGDPVVTLDGLEVPTGQVVPVAPGQRLSIGVTRKGLRTYLAVAGGIERVPVLGSQSTDTLSWLGPGPLVAGDELGVGVLAGALADHLSHQARASVAGGEQRLRVLPGPHAEWFHPDALGALARSDFRVEEHSDRVGVRLRPTVGSPPLPLRPDVGPLDSSPAVTGAIQVPPSADPVVLSVDHATLGGYPVLAVVISADLSRLGQCRPGDPVSFQVVDLDLAREAWSAHCRVLAGAAVGRYPTEAAG